MKNALPPSYQSLQPHSPMVSIVVPMLHNRTRTFGKIIEAVRKIENPTIEMVMVSNTIATEALSRENFEPPDKPVNKWAVLSHNVGVAAAWNLGLALSEGDVVIFLNDDAVPDAETLCRMAYTLVEQPEIGVVGVEGHNFEWVGPPPMTAPNGGCFRGFESYGLDDRRPHWKVPPKEGVETQVVTGHCFAARREDLVALNGFDLRYSPAFAEEYDFCFRAREVLGKRVLTIPGNVRHAIGVSRSGGGIVYLSGYVLRDPHIVHCNWLFHKRFHPESPERGR